MCVDRAKPNQLPFSVQWKSLGARRFEKGDGTSGKFVGMEIITSDGHIVWKKAWPCIPRSTSAAERPSRESKAPFAMAFHRFNNSQFRSQFKLLAELTWIWRGITRSQMCKWWSKREIRGFQTCAKLRRIEIPASVEISSHDGFKQCVHVKEVTYDEDNHKRADEWLRRCLSP
jgi:hypothetical protein